MDLRAHPLDAADPEAADPEAVEFVRFCRARRRVGWPELYDEMWAVASRSLFRGYGCADLEERGIGFSLFGTPHLAAMAAAVIEEERAAGVPGQGLRERRRSAAASR
ncbi:MAG: hypothetical protein V2B17_08795 [Chloroflexota bacterium]